MKTFKEWLRIKVTGASAGVPYVGQSPGQDSGGWEGAPSGGKLKSAPGKPIKNCKKK